MAYGLASGLLRFPRGCPLYCALQPIAEQAGPGDVRGATGCSGYRRSLGCTGQGRGLCAWVTGIVIEQGKTLSAKAGCSTARIAALLAADKRQHTVVVLGKLRLYVRGVMLLKVVRLQFLGWDRGRALPR